jgi:16S rRNA (uracil1498-N3)-methyltransferase
MHRFFVPSEWIENDPIIFQDEIVHQMKNVLRIKAGEEVELLDNKGKEFLVRIEIDKDRWSGKIVEKRVVEGEPRIHLNLLFALTQREKVEWILQKATEIGVSRLIPLVTERSLVREVDSINSKIERWRSILKEAAEQSGRGLIPILEGAASFSQGLDYIEQLDLALIAWEEEKKEGLKEILQSGDHQKIGVMIGPEGGFSEEEHQQAINRGWKSVTLGKRVLRMETAALVACALIVNICEDSLD